MYNERNKLTIPTDEALDKELNKRWEPKPLGTSTEFGFVGGGKYVREMWIRDRQQICERLREIHRSEHTRTEINALINELENGSFTILRSL